MQSQFTDSNTTTKILQTIDSYINKQLELKGRLVIIDNELYISDMEYDPNKNEYIEISKVKLTNRDIIYTLLGKIFLYSGNRGCLFHECSIQGMLLGTNNDVSIQPNLIKIIETNGKGQPKITEVKIDNEIINESKNRFPPFFNEIECHSNDWLELALKDF